MEESIMSIARLLLADAEIGKEMGR